MDRNKLRSVSVWPDIYHYWNNHNTGVDVVFQVLLSSQTQVSVQVSLPIAFYVLYPFLIVIIVACGFTECS